MQYPNNEKNFGGEQTWQVTQQEEWKFQRQKRQWTVLKWKLQARLEFRYNGDLTSDQNGSVGGEMVRQMIKKQEESMAGRQ